MKVKLGTLSRKATAAAIGGALALAGVGVGTAAVLSPTSTAPASDQTEVTEPAATSAEPTAEPTQAAPVVEQPEQAAPTSSVAAVTSNQQPAPKPQQQAASDGAEESTPYDPTAPFEQGGVTYVPAPEPPPEPTPATQPPVG